MHFAQEWSVCCIISIYYRDYCKIIRLTTDLHSTFARRKSQHSLKAIKMLAIQNARANAYFISWLPNGNVYVWTNTVRWCRLIELYIWRFIVRSEYMDANRTDRLPIETSFECFDCAWTINVKLSAVTFTVSHSQQLYVLPRMGGGYRWIDIELWIIWHFAQEPAGRRRHTHTHTHLSVTSGIDGAQSVLLLLAASSGRYRTCRQYHGATQPLTGEGNAYSDELHGSGYICLLCRL